MMQKGFASLWCADWQRAAVMSVDAMSAMRERFGFIMHIG